MQLCTDLDNIDMFTGVLASLGPAAHKLQYMYATPTLDVRNQLLLTLIKLRLYITNFQLGRMFEVTQLEVYALSPMFLQPMDDLQMTGRLVREVT
ncbi:hypothetical protein LSH36_2779g00003 [Paralvinella palmiformis]|uniref:Transposase Helix-turn-helix domain-containing protein n=1 Tax=Paralvinella palmiformis TaxID=53620 RepID=A0AAD9MK57_9ANNE|nr:hypothetical protein LSH36_2779g00003 [Paralvinella palmiformis]